MYVRFKPGRTAIGGVQYNMTGKGFIKTMETINNTVLKVLDTVTIVLVIGMVGMLLIQVVARYFFNTGFAWTEESARYMMIYLIYLGACMISINGKHVNITVAEDALKGWAHKLLKIFHELVMIVFLVMIINFSSDALRIAGMQSSPSIGINMFFVMIVIPVGAVIMLFAHFTRMLKMVLSWKGDDK